MLLSPVYRCCSGGLRCCPEDCEWSLITEALAGAFVEQARNGFDVLVGMPGEVGVLREELTGQAVEVLVRAALPRAAALGEVDADTCRGGQLLVADHLDPLVPGERLRHVRRQRGERR